MLNKIKEILKSEGIEKYLINKIEKSSSELFFIRKSLDTRREKNITNYDVTVFRDVEKDGSKLLGSALISVYPTMTDKEIGERLKSAYFAAQFAANPYYELEKGDGTVKTVESASKSSEEAAAAMAGALFSVDVHEDAFINSAEIFAENQHIRIVNSNGIDVSYNKFTVYGEFITQCTTEEDVELYYDFEYNEVNEKALAEKAEEGIKAARDRSSAQRSLKGGNYDVILSGESMATVFEYYIGKSNAAFIYAKYSDYKVGDELQGSDAKGEKLNLTLAATEPYSNQGIKMSDLVLTENGTLKAIHGTSRFAQYLGIKPTGPYSKIRLEAGTKSFDEMKKAPYLHIIKFSDFQMDNFTGHFGGEIRLAYHFDGKNVSKVTGGSVNGIITEAHKNFIFSKERYSDSHYEGPFAVRIENAAVAGSE